jgi:Ca2+-binding EF-hand superfamily protein
LNNENYEIKNKNANLIKDNKNYELSINLNLNKEKIIPISELISILNEIYEHSNKQNEKLNKLNLPEINLVDSINPYLTTKYGIKSIATHWNNKIMEGINLYYNIDSEINLFKKILEGKINENFYLNYINMKSSCKNIILQNLKKKYTYKSNLELDNLLDEKLIGFIKYEEWIEIINNNLEYIDKEEAINEVMNYINKRNKIDEKYQKINESNINRLNILFNDFTKVLLNIQINSREKYLNRLSTNFKICDKDNDGYINRKEFEELIRSFKNIYFINNKLIESLLEKIDPLRKNKISFNQCVEILGEKNLDNQSILELMQ